MVLLVASIYGAATKFTAVPMARLAGSVAASVTCAAAVTWLAHAGCFVRLRRVANSRVSFAVNLVVVPAFIWLFSWLVLGRALPALVNNLAGEDRMVAVTIDRETYYSGRRWFSSTGYRAIVSIPGIDRPSRHPVTVETYARLSAGTPGTALIRQSPLGARVLELYPGTNLPRTVPAHERP